jgi:signal transduction histidine kinase
MAVALRFTNEQGIIGVEFSHGRDRETVVKVTSSGEGIPAEALGKLMERHYISSSIPPEQNGDMTNAGLTGLYDIVGMHGGRVFLNSRTGEGTTFLFTLPAVTFDGEGVRYEQAINSSRR